MTSDKLEEDLARALTEGTMEAEDPKREALRHLSPRYEARTQAERDPIVEETERYRQMAEEVDDRYDDYMKRAGRYGEDKKKPD